MDLSGVSHGFLESNQPIQPGTRLERLHAPLNRVKRALQYAGYNSKAQVLLFFERNKGNNPTDYCPESINKKQIET